MSFINSKFRGVVSRDHQLHQSAVLTSALPRRERRSSRQHMRCSSVASSSAIVIPQCRVFSTPPGGGRRRSTTSSSSIAGSRGGSDLSGSGGRRSRARCLPSVADAGEPQNKGWQSSRVRLLLREQHGEIGALSSRCGRAIARSRHRPQPIDAPSPSLRGDEDPRRPLKITRSIMWARLVSRLASRSWAASPSR